ncbi:MAG TPA: ATPase domain-containing protein, partial [Burkholderiales bacterium]|nr:ATPase domain-containing protein [Burkholderiales bacterium]
MAKAKSVYVCSECGAQSPKWVGQCAACNAWSTLQETLVAAPSRTGRIRTGATVAQSLEEVTPQGLARLPTGVSELDRVLGGGLVPGSVVLIGGDPGIGKSTLLIQALAEIGRQATVLYVSGEESADQIALRAHRLGLHGQSVRLLTENQVENILSCAREERPQVMVVDSIQTMFTDMLESAPGSVAQVR